MSNTIPVHRSRTKVHLTDRHHLHDGLRFMPGDVPRTHGWHIPAEAIGNLLEKADAKEEVLYRAHDYAHRIGTQLYKATKDVQDEYERTGVPTGLTFEEFMARSRSIIVAGFKEKEKLMSIAVDQLSEAITGASEEEGKMLTDIGLLQKEFADSAMQCRMLDPHEFDGLDVRVKKEVMDAGSGYESVVIPFRNTAEMIEGRRRSKKTQIMDLVNDGAQAFVGIGCPIDSTAIARCVTLKHNPTLPPRLGMANKRLGRCLRILFLADNALGPAGLEAIAQGMQYDGQLEVLHYIDNGAGEAGKAEAGLKDEHMKSIAAFRKLADVLMMPNCTLRILNLSNNCISAAGASCISSGLKECRSLEMLDLSFNEFGVAGANYLAKAITFNKSVTFLNINNTLAGHAGVKSIVSALGFNEHIRTLYAKQNVGRSAAAELDAMLRGNTTLQAVYLFDDVPWINANYIPAGLVNSSFNTRRDQSGLSDNLERSVQRRHSGLSVTFSEPDQSIIEHQEYSSDIGNSDVGSGDPRRPDSVATSEPMFSDSVAEDTVFRVAETESVQDPHGRTDVMSDSNPAESEQDKGRNEITSRRSSQAGSRPSSAGTVDPRAHMEADADEEDLGMTVDSKLLTNESFRLLFFARPATPEERVKTRDVDIAMQLEKMHTRIEVAKKNMKGVKSVRADQRIEVEVEPGKTIQQGWGPLLKCGINMPTSAQIIGFKAGGVDKSNVPCEYCRANPKKKAGCGPYGHESYECPKRFFEEHGEVMPGFTFFGEHELELWNGTQSDPEPAVKKLWDELKAKGFFLETGNPPPQDYRENPLATYSKAGKLRNEWQHKGAYQSIDIERRKKLFESGRGWDPFTRGADELLAFLESREREKEKERPPDYNPDYMPSAKKRDKAFLQKVRHNHLDEAADFLNQRYGPIDVNVHDDTGISGLISAVQNGYKRMTKLLVKCGADLDKTDLKGNTALHYAAAFNHHSIFNHLKQKGADDSLMNVQGKTCYEGLA